MNNKKLFVALIVVMIIGAVYYLFCILKPKPSANNQPINNSASLNATEEQDASATTVTYTDPASKESVTVTFSPDGQTANLNGLGYDGVVLTVATSGSGARYVNEAEGLEAWNRGEEVTISRGEKEVFKGNVGGLTNLDRLTTAKWSWQATTIADSVVEPKVKDAFVISFDAKEGTVSATTDCNTVFGPYTANDNGTLTFGAMAMTKKYCENSEEGIFVDQLAEVRAYYFNGSGALALQFGSSTDHMLLGKK